MNVRLLRKVATHISENPRRFQMKNWVQHKADVSRVTDDAVFGDEHSHRFARCGTAACIGGWAVILSEKKKIQNTSTIFSRAKRALELTCGEAEILFSVFGWPEQFKDKFLSGRSPATRVRAAVARIEHFIKTRGKE